MKQLLPSRWILPTGLLLLSGGLLLNLFHLIPDFVSGFLIGLGISFVVGSFIKKWYVNRAG